jgi:hypothetical protein
MLWSVAVLNFSMQCLNPTLESSCWSRALAPSALPLSRKAQLPLFTTANSPTSLMPAPSKPGRLQRKPIRPGFFRFASHPGVAAARFHYILLHRFAFRETCAVKTEVGTQRCCHAAPGFTRTFWIAGDQIPRLGVHECSFRRGFCATRVRPDSRLHPGTPQPSALRVNAGAALSLVLLQSELSIMQVLHTSIFCGDGLSLAATSQLVSHGVGSVMVTSLMNVS